MRAFIAEKTDDGVTRGVRELSADATVIVTDRAGTVL